MIIIRTIDLKDGKCVRLRQGNADDVKVYSKDPVGMAEHWVSEGAAYLHVVDLDGAFAGKPTHTKLIERIVATVSIPVEVGGGLRTDDDVKTLLDHGVDRVIVGTRAFTDAVALSQLARKYGPHLAVGIDARSGMVQVKGWVETTNMTAVDLAVKADEMGVRTIIYTDTSVDGMMTGVNIEAVKNVCSKVKCDVIASGGVSSADDTSALRELGFSNLIGVIVGKALYERTVTLKELG